MFYQRSRHSAQSPFYEARKKTDMDTPSPDAFYMTTQSSRLKLMPMPPPPKVGALPLHTYHVRQVIRAHTVIIGFGLRSDLMNGARRIVHHPHREGG